MKLSGFAFLTAAALFTCAGMFAAESGSKRDVNIVPPRTRLGCKHARTGKQRGRRQKCKS